MKIGNQQSAQINSAQLRKIEQQAETKNSEASQESTELSEGAKSSISSRAKEMATARKIADEAPDLREEKIAALKERIQNGDYNVKPEEVADRIVKEHLAEL